MNGNESASVGDNYGNLNIQNNKLNEDRYTIEEVYIEKDKNKIEKAKSFYDRKGKEYTGQLMIEFGVSDLDDLTQKVFSFQKLNKLQPVDGQAGPGTMGKRLGLNLKKLGYKGIIKHLELKNGAKEVHNNKTEKVKLESKKGLNKLKESNIETIEELKNNYKEKLDVFESIIERGIPKLEEHINVFTKDKIQNFISILEKFQSFITAQKLEIISGRLYASEMSKNLKVLNSLEKDLFPMLEEYGFETNNIENKENKGSVSVEEIYVEKDKNKIEKAINFYGRKGEEYVKQLMIEFGASDQYDLTQKVFSFQKLNNLKPDDGQAGPGTMGKKLASNFSKSKYSGIIKHLKLKNGQRESNKVKQLTLSDKLEDTFAGTIKELGTYVNKNGETQRVLLKKYFEEIDSNDYMQEEPEVVEKYMVELDNSGEFIDPDVKFDHIPSKSEIKEAINKMKADSVKLEKIGKVEKEISKKQTRELNPNGKIKDLTPKGKIKDLTPKGKLQDGMYVSESKESSTDINEKFSNTLDKIDFYIKKGLPILKKERNFINRFVIDKHIKMLSDFKVGIPIVRKKFKNGYISNNQMEDLIKSVKEVDKELTPFLEEYGFDMNELENKKSVIKKENIENKNISSYDKLFNNSNNGFSILEQLKSTNEKLKYLKDLFSEKFDVDINEISYKYDMVSKGKYEINVTTDKYSYNILDIEERDKNTFIQGISLFQILNAKKSIENKNIEYGISLGGGGGNAPIHFAHLEKMERSGIDIEKAYLVGSSAGSLISVMYSLAKTFQPKLSAKEIFTEYYPKDLKGGLKKSGNKLDSFKKSFSKIIKDGKGNIKLSDLTFDDLKIPVMINYRTEGNEFGVASGKMPIEPFLNASVDYSFEDIEVSIDGIGVINDMSQGYDMGGKVNNANPYKLFDYMGIKKDKVYVSGILGGTTIKGKIEKEDLNNYGGFYIDSGNPGDFSVASNIIRFENALKKETDTI